MATMRRFDSVESIAGQIASIQDYRPKNAHEKKDIPRYIMVYTGLLSIIGFTHGLQAAAFFGGLTTIEKAFRFSSTQMGLANAMFVVGFAGTQPIWSYLADRMYKPYLYAFGLFVVELSNTIPILMSFKYTVTMDTNPDGGSSTSTAGFSNASTISFDNPLATIPLCTLQSEGEFSNSSNSISDLIEDSAEQSYNNLIPYALYSLWSLIFGIGFAPQFSLALTHIDDHVPETATAFMMSIPTAAFAIGPIFGFMIIGNLLMIHHDFSTPSYGPMDARWIGNWWIMYPTMGFLACIISIIIACQTRREPIRRTGPNDEYSNNNNDYISVKAKTDANRKTSTVESIRNSGLSFFTSIKDLFSSRLYVLILIASALTAFSLVGFDYFLIKILGAQFQKDPSSANEILSGVSFGAACAIVIGGYVSKRFNFTMQKLLFILTLVHTIQFTLMAVLLFTKCPKQEIPSLELKPGPRTGLPQLQVLSANCSSSCSCMNTFQPICGSDDQLYYSPCTAGCAEVDHQNGFFRNCSCISGESWARDGHCPSSSCIAGPIYIALVILQRMAMAFGRVYLFAVCLRSVSAENKTLAMGIRSMCGSIFGDVGSSTILGYVIDLACMSWVNPDTESGNCWFYDNDALHLWFHLLPLGALLFAVITYFAAWKFAKSTEK